MRFIYIVSPDVRWACRIYKIGGGIGGGSKEVIHYYTEVVIRR